MQVCDICGKPLKDKTYSLSIKTRLNFKCWYCCSEECLGAAIEKGKIKIPVTTTYQEVIEAEEAAKKTEQLEITEKFKEARKIRRQALIMQASAMMLSIIAIILNIITEVIRVMQ